MQCPEQPQKETGMTDALDPIMMNFLYAALGGLMTLGFMWLGCNMFNRIVCNFDIGASYQQEGNYENPCIPHTYFKCLASASVSGWSSDWA